MCRFNNSYIFDCSKLRNNNPANVEFFQQFYSTPNTKTNSYYRQCYMR